MATNMYIEFDTPKVTGDATDSRHKDAVESLSWNHGFTQPTSPVRSSAGGGTVEQAQHQNFSFTKRTDCATDDLLKHCWSGKQFGKATVHIYRANGNNTATKYLEILMEHVVVSNISLSGGAGDMPVENVSLDYGVVTYKYTPLKADGANGGAQPAKHNLETRSVE
jgi:type VI secretion system secreted protein Hcp